MMTCYILWSPSLKKYYIGSTVDQTHKRLNKHNNAFYKASFTSQASDWKIFFEIPCTCKKQMLQVEKHIKSMKSKTYIENLMKYPEISIKLLEKYTCE